jgi:glycosyltransferase involved in cell wall biosynthesis
MGRRIGGASIVHLHGVWDPLLLLAAVQARRHRVPYFVLVNGMLDSWCLAQNALKKRVALSTLHGLLLRRAAAIHVNSEEERSRLRDLGLSVRTVVVANGVFVPTWLAARAPEPDRRSPVLLFLGRLHPKKGVDILIDAFAKLAWEHPSLQLVVAGPDEGVVRPAMEAVRKAQLGDRVAFPGPVFGEEKWRLLGRATCFCLPSRQEGFSMAVLEAMACGLPVVISDACHFQQVAAAGAGFVVPGEASHVAAALRRLLDNAALCRQMAANGQRLVTEQYTWSAVAGRLLEAYKNPSKKPG